MPDIPDAITSEVLYWQRRLRWPELVPAWAEMPDADGKIWFHRYQSLTIALCEQATEFHVREARRLIAKWTARPSKGAAREAGRHIVWARIYRCRYFELSSIRNTREADMPFAFGKISGHE